MRMQRDVTLLKTSVTLLQRDVKLRHTDCRALAAKHGVHDNSDRRVNSLLFAVVRTVLTTAMMRRRALEDAGR